MPTVVIGIKAKLDADVASLFAPLERRAQVAAARIQKTFADAMKAGTAAGGFGRVGAGGGGGSAEVSAETQMNRVIAKAAREVELEKRKLARETAREKARLASEELQSQRRLLRLVLADQKKADNERERSAKKTADDITRNEKIEANKREAAARASAARIEADQKAAARQRESRIRGAVEYTARATVNRIGHGVSRVAQGAAGMVGDVARGAGVDFSLGSYVQKHVEADQMARALSNAAYQPNAKGTAAATRVAPELLRETANRVASKTGHSQTEVLGGLAKFQELTGNLGVGLSAIERFAVLARATNTPLESLAGAAGKATLALRTQRDAEGKPLSDEEIGNQTDKILRILAGQGQVGAFEMADVVKQGGKLFASAPMFAGGVLGNMEQAGMMAQMALATGGADSPAVAGNAVRSMFTTINTPARMAKFEEHGVELTDKKTGLFRPMQDIVTDSIVKTKGDAKKMHEMWANIMGYRGVQTLLTTYTTAGKGQAGAKAIQDQFAGWKTAGMGDEQIKNSFGVEMEGVAMKAALFNNNMQNVVGKLADTIIPMLEKEGPAISKAVQDVATAVGKFAPEIEKIITTITTWTSEAAANPVTTMVEIIGAAIAIQIGKALTVELLTAAVMAVVKGGAGSLMPSLGAGGMFAAAGKWLAGAGGTVATAGRAVGGAVTGAGVATGALVTGGIIAGGAMINNMLTFDAGAQNAGAYLKALPGAGNAAIQNALSGNASPEHLLAEADKLKADRERAEEMVSAGTAVTNAMEVTMGVGDGLNSVAIATGMGGNIVPARVAAYDRKTKGGLVAMAGQTETIRATEAQFRAAALAQQWARGQATDADVEDMKNKLTYQIGGQDMSTLAGQNASRTYTETVNMLSGLLDKTLKVVITGDTRTQVGGGGTTSGTGQNMTPAQQLDGRPRAQPCPQPSPRSSPRRSAASSSPS